MPEMSILSDPNAPAVLDIYNFFSSGRIYAPHLGFTLAQSLDPCPVKSFAQARRLIGGRSYKKVISIEEGRLYGIENQLSYPTTKHINDERISHGSFYCPYLSREIIEDTVLISQIGGAAGFILLHRILEGTADTFFERLFALYRAGWLPCGWEGDYPEGRFKAYRPSE